MIREYAVHGLGNMVTISDHLAALSTEAEKVAILEKQVSVLNSSLASTDRARQAFLDERDALKQEVERLTEELEGSEFNSGAYELGMNLAKSELASLRSKLSAMGKAVTDEEARQFHSTDLSAIAFANWVIASRASQPNPSEQEQS